MMTMSMARGLKLGRCSKRKKSTDDDDGLLLSPLRKKNKTISPARRLGKNKKISPARYFRLGRSCLTAKKRKASEQQIKKGDKVDLSTLLFTKHRNYLLRGDNQRVPAKQLAGKVIVLYFMNLVSGHDNWMQETTCLVDIYNELQPKGCLEVIFVAAPDATVCSTREVYSTPEEQRFEERYSIMPWLSIPFWDLESRKHLEKLFGGISGFSDRYPVSFVVDPAGVVLQCNGEYYFQEYGAPGYPFSDEKIKTIISEDNAARQHPSITTLLASPERNYVISNSGDQVLVSDLEDKVVALYFYEEPPVGESPDDLTPKIEMVYRELAKNEENFEIVLVYTHDTVYTYDCTTEVSFWKTFSTMPWLALPFKDPNCKRLQRIFDHPETLKELEPDPTLVIIGPHGNFIEDFGADILLKFGIAAYPFTRESAAKLEAEKAKRVKLEMFWRDPNTFFRPKDGPDVRFSQLAGKRTILLFGDGWFNKCVDFFRVLKARYIQMKNTNNEFEVIHISYEVQGSPYKQRVAATPTLTHPPFAQDSPWLTHPAFAYDSNERKLLLSVFRFGRGLLAFDKDGRLLRRTICPSIEREDVDFPFHSGSLEKDAVIELVSRFHWGS